jgi:hypothetical protein
MGYAAIASAPIASIKLPETLTEIGEYAMDQCGELTTIDIPASVKSIGKSAFNKCSKLATATSRNTAPPTIDSLIFDETPIAAVYVPEASVAAYEADQYWGSYNIVGADFSGINEVAANADSNAAKKCYNLNGVRLNPDELRPGLYIVNGKKTIVQ